MVANSVRTACVRCCRRRRTTHAHAYTRQQIFARHTQIHRDAGLGGCSCAVHVWFARRDALRRCKAMNCAFYLPVLSIFVFITSVDKSAHSSRSMCCFSSNALEAMGASGDGALFMRILRPTTRADTYAVPQMSCYPSLDSPIGVATDQIYRTDAVHVEECVSSLKLNAVLIIFCSH